MATITLPDQFITNNLVSYSGSYSDQYMYGNIFSNYVQYSSGTSDITSNNNGTAYSQYSIPNTISGVIDFRRTSIGYTVDRAISLLNNKTLWYSDYLNITKGRYIPSRTANYTTTLVDGFEHYYDSYTASPVQYFKEAGKLLTHNIYSHVFDINSKTVQAYQYMSGSRFSVSTASLEDYNYPDLMSLSKKTAPTGSIAITIFNDNGTFSSPTYLNNSMFDWMNMYPFQSKYKNIAYANKNLINSRYLSNEEKVEFASELSGTSPYPITSSVLGNITVKYRGPSNTETNDTATNYLKGYSAVLSDVMISGSEGDFFTTLDSQNGSSTSGSYWNSFVQRRTTFRLEHQNNLFFGIGESYMDMGKHVSYLSTSLIRNAIPFIAGEYKMHVAAPIIRGFKYGLVNSNKKALTAHWRRDHFGQFRDMLEQRQYTKIYADYSNYSINSPSNPVNLYKNSFVNDDVPRSTITDGIIRVTFLSGTEAALFAENYINWNPATDSIATLSNSRDSGIYDIEYRSGQPFDDTN